jgi:imidazolonepropionase-like amidohydrolase
VADAAGGDAARGGNLGSGRDLGTIEAGKLADLIVVRDDPLADIDNVRTLQMVFKGRRLVADHRLDVPAPWTRAGLA